MPIFCTFSHSLFVSFRSSDESFSRRPIRFLSFAMLNQIAEFAWVLRLMHLLPLVVFFNNYGAEISFQIKDYCFKIISRLIGSLSIYLTITLYLLAFMCLEHVLWGHGISEFQHCFFLFCCCFIWVGDLYVSVFALSLFLIKFIFVCETLRYCRMNCTVPHTHTHTHTHLRTQHLSFLLFRFHFYLVIN